MMEECTMYDVRFLKNKVRFTINEVRFKKAHQWIDLLATNYWLLATNY